MTPIREIGSATEKGPVPPALTATVDAQTVSAPLAAAEPVTYLTSGVVCPNGSSPPNTVCTRNIYDPKSVTITESTSDFGKKAADLVIDAVRKNPRAVIILPTGSTPGPMYRELVERFRTDASLDFSGVRFFNLDEYVGLPEDHPLSYRFFMENIFYNHLREIDASRAPKNENIHIPHVEITAGDIDTNGELTHIGREKSQEAAFEYMEEFSLAIRQNGGKADLAVVGIGGAYPDRETDTIKGGHIGFNEPGSKLTDKTRLEKLTDKTKGDTRYRFRNIKYLIGNGLLAGNYATDVPNYAITMGVNEIVNYTDRVLLLANGEEKAPVIEQFFKTEPSSDFPSTYLKYHSDYHLVLDTDAASKIPHTQSPWSIYGLQSAVNEPGLRQLVIKAVKDNNIKVEELESTHLVNVGIDTLVVDQIASGVGNMADDASMFLQNQIYRNDEFEKFRGRKVLIFSPHPDDDVICCSATIQKLVNAGAEVQIAYVTSGENAVRKDLVLSSGLLPPNFNQLDGDMQETILQKARIEIRKQEARNAVRKLGLKGKASDTTFFNSPFYYTRGFVHLNPIRRDVDVKPVKDLITKFSPDFIFYSAENDPHGAHGLSAKVIREAVKEIPDSRSIEFWGYRGAYNEWDLHEDPEKLAIVPYDETAWQAKDAAILEHVSQRNPMFPSFDKREFNDRAHERNRNTGDTLQRLGYANETEPYAEVFRRFSFDEFVA